MRFLNRSIMPVFGWGWSGGGGGKRYYIANITAKGAYASGTTYAANDMVTDGGNCYVSVQGANVGHTPASSPTWWMLFPTGPAGATGATGPAGATGSAGSAGRGVASILKTGTVGNVDTYTITFTDASAATFTVTNGTGNGHIVVDAAGVEAPQRDKLKFTYTVSGVDFAVTAEDDTANDVTIVNFNFPETISGGTF